MLLQGEILPLGLHLLVFLQHGAGFGVADAHFSAALHHLAENDGVDALSLKVRPNGNEQQVNGVIFPEGVEHMNPACGQQPAPALFQRLGNAGGADTKGHQLVLFIENKAGKLGIDEGGELHAVLFDLCRGQIHGAVERGIRLVHKLEKGLQQGEIAQPGADLQDVQLLPPLHIGRELGPAGDSFFVLRSGNEIFTQSTSFT